MSNHIGEKRPYARREWRFDSGTVISVGWHHGRGQWMAEYESGDIWVTSFSLHKKRALKRVRIDLASRVLKRLSDPKKSPSI